MEISLEYIEKYAGELYISQAGHLEFTYSANADQALNMAFNAPVGKPFGFFCGSPAAIGLVMADLAVKASPVEVIRYMTPDQGTSHSNEVIVAVTGDASAVKNAVGCWYLWEAILRRRQNRFSDISLLYRIPFFSI